MKIERSTVPEDTTTFIADWENGRFQRETRLFDSEIGEVSTIVISGDWGPDVNQQHALETDPAEFYGDVVRVFENSEFSIVNLEAPVSGAGKPAVKDGPNIAVDVGSITAGLGALGCSAVCMANNHIMDFGYEGLAATLNTLKAMGVQGFGAGKDIDHANQPLIVDLGGFRIGFLNFAEGEEAKASIQSAGVASLDLPRAHNRISSLVKSVDSVVAIVHAGRQYVPLPPPYIQAAYRSLADAGASLVIGHHPHVPQGIEIWQGTPIIYSLGNFVFRRTSDIFYRNIGYLLVLQVIDGKVYAFEIKPYAIRENGLVFLKESQRDDVLTELEKTSRYLVLPFLEDAWDAYADLWWQSCFPDELISFAMLMSWRGWASAIAYRIYLDCSCSRSAINLMCRLVRRGLRLVAEKLPPQRQAEPHFAAVLRNRFDTPAHLELYKTALSRAMTGRIGTSALWARDLLSDWGSIL
jgi:poly-gamma-glutamate capsule biosynthesis protein CapA/YwtB (metallophosphatase superfamily)